MKYLLFILIFCKTTLLFGLANKSVSDYVEDPKKGLSFYYEKYIKFQYSDSDSAMIYAQKQLRLAQKLNDKVWIGKSYRSIAHLFREQGFLGDAVHNYLEAIKCFKLIDEELHMADNFIYIGDVFFKAHDYRNALTYFDAALDLYYKNEAVADAMFGHFNMGLCYVELGAFNEAKDHLNRSLELAVKTGNQDFKIKALNNFGSSLFQQELYSEARVYYQEVFSMAGVVSDSLIVRATALNNIGESYLYEGNLEEAEKWLLKSLTLKKGLHDPVFVGSTLSLLGELYLKKGESGQALRYFEDGLDSLKLPITDKETTLRLSKIIQLLNEKVLIGGYANNVSLLADSRKLAAYTNLYMKRLQHIEKEKEKLEELNKQYILQMAVEKYAYTTKLAHTEEIKDKYRMVVVLPLIMFIALSIVFIWLFIQWNQTRNFLKLLRARLEV